MKVGKVKYVFRNLPREAIPPHTFKAAGAANCAGEQGKYWQMHDRLLADQSRLGPAELPGHAEALGLDTAKFKECLDSAKHSTQIRNEMAEAFRAGVTGTPTFFLGRTEPDGRVEALRMIRGAQRYPVFKEAIEALLSWSQP